MSGPGSLNYQQLISGAVDSRLNPRLVKDAVEGRIKRDVRGIKGLRIRIEGTDGRNLIATFKLRLWARIFLGQTKAGKEQELVATMYATVPAVFNFQAFAE